MSVRKTPPSGEMFLGGKYEESASGHYEENYKVKLTSAENNTVILEEYLSVDQFIGQAKHERKRTYYEIKVDDLIELIKLNSKLIKKEIKIN